MLFACVYGVWCDACIWVCVHGTPIRWSLVDLAGMFLLLVCFSCWCDPIMNFDADPWACSWMEFVSHSWDQPNLAQIMISVWSMLIKILTMKRFNHTFNDKIILKCQSIGNDGEKSLDPHVPLSSLLFFLCIFLLPFPSLFLILSLLHTPFGLPTSSRQWIWVA